MKGCIAIKKTSIRRGAIILVLTAIAYWLAQAFGDIDISSLSFFSQQKDDEFTTSDLYDQASHNNMTVAADSTVVIVGVDWCDHSRIAEILTVIRAGEPQVIGMDFIFENLTLEDSTFCMALLYAADRLVYPVTVDPDTGERETYPSESFINSEVLEGATPGNVAFPTLSPRQVVREYYANLTGIPSFPMAVAMRYDPEAAARVSERGNTLEWINYIDRDIIDIHGNELLDGDIDIDYLRDKVVILGYLEDLGDTHATPISDAMPGTKILGYCVASILSGRHLRSAPDWLVALVSLLTGIGIIALCYAVKDEDYNNLVSHIIPIVILLLGVLAGYKLYAEHLWYFDLAPVLLMAGSAMLVFDIWLGIGRPVCIWAYDKTNDWYASHQGRIQAAIIRHKARVSSLRTVLTAHLAATIKRLKTKKKKNK